MSITPQKLARELKQVMEQADRASGMPIGAMAYAWQLERESGQAGEVSAWIEHEAEKIKAAHARREKVLSPAGLRGLFAGLK